MDNKFSLWVKQYSPELLTVTGICGLAFSVAWAIPATIKATKICEELKAKEDKTKLTAKEVVKNTWKLYWPVALGTAIGVPCLIASNRVSSIRSAALSTACTLSAQALQDYREKTKALIGEAKEKEIISAVNQDKLDKTEKPNTMVLIDNDSEELFFEPLTGRYFKSTWNKIELARNELVEKALNSCTGSFTLNDWFYALGLEEVSPAAGDTLGWCTNACGYGDGMLRIDMTTHKTKDNKACGCIDYLVRPYPLR